MGQKHSQLKPHAVCDLMRMTDFSDKELQDWYQSFQKDSDHGQLTKQDFIKIFQKLFPDCDATKFSDHVFRTFDINKDGFLNFREFVIGLSLTLKGTFEEKLYWSFKIYDVDGNGYISQSELREIVAAMYALCRSKDVNISKDLFASLDKDCDGRVSWAEFRSGVSQNKELTEFMMKSLNCDCNDVTF